jgi:hypothetical protein
LACALGCGHEVDPAPEAAIVAESAASPALTVEPDAKPAAAPDLANPKVTTAAAAFTPPFPDRLELFEAPKRAQSTVRRDDEHGETVELKGFINVDQPRVVLSIDGVVSPVPEGGERYGVRVISIQPPSVVLQRGRNRWTATLE